MENISMHTYIYTYTCNLRAHEHMDRNEKKHLHGCIPTLVPSGKPQRTVPWTL